MKEYFGTIESENVKEYRKNKSKVNALKETIAKLNEEKNGLNEEISVERERIRLEEEEKARLEAEEELQNTKGKKKKKKK